MPKLTKLEKDKCAAWGLPDGNLEQYSEGLDEEVGGVPVRWSRPELPPEEFPPPELDLR